MKRMIIAHFFTFQIDSISIVGKFNKLLIAYDCNTQMHRHSKSSSDVHNRIAVKKICSNQISESFFGFGMIICFCIFYEMQL